MASYMVYIFVTHFYFLSLISRFSIFRAFFAFEMAREAGRGICIVQRIAAAITECLTIKNI